MNRLDGKNILITGASSGIGKACALECCKEGATVHLIARNNDRLEEVARRLEIDRYSVYALDVTKSEDIEPIIRQIVDKHGKIDGFIHSAGAQSTQPFRTMDKNHYIEVFSLNTIAAFDISRILIKKQYCSQNGISLVFISSVMSIVGDAGITSYCASKAALVGGTRAMAIELAPKNIRVNCVSPGTVMGTKMTEGLKSNLSIDEFRRIVSQYPMGLGQTEDAAKLCVFLLSGDSKWITGQNLVVDGGYSAK